jgi:hypothetical protein
MTNITKLNGSKTKSQARLLARELITKRLEDKKAYQFKSMTKSNIFKLAFRFESLGLSKSEALKLAYYVDIK